MRIRGIAFIAIRSLHQSGWRKIPISLIEGNDRSKTQKLPVCRKVVKPPTPPIFSQAADSDGNINLKIWRVYPLQFASLEVEANSTGATGNPARAFFIGVQLKKKSRKSLEQPLQVAPLVRGPLDAKQKGEVGELAFLHKAASLGFGVAQPHGDSELYDFILDSGERFWRVQVKSIYLFSSRYGTELEARIAVILITRLRKLIS